MLPIVLDMNGLRAAVVGGGPQACRRLQILDEAGAGGVKVFSIDPSEEMRKMAGPRLEMRPIRDDEISQLALVFVANETEAEAARITQVARTSKTLVNVEDVKPQCDFHVPAVVRRGDLLLTASSGGKSPALARRLKGFLAARFPEAWGGYVEQIAQAREGWRAQGLSFKDVTDRSNAMIDEKGWLECQCPLTADNSSKTS
ncbi:MAG: precorrin-2 dehydrogenase/sirohydrochlorin ferrochelatase family protein [Parvibaculales bacterium]